MKNLDDLVRDVVANFINQNMLFTALDISNSVKLKMPLARHREVRDVVKNMFVSDIEPSGYARTPITVTLTNGSTAETLLYHSLVDSWDIDNKYDVQKRGQGTPKPISIPVTITAPSVAAPVSAGVVAVTVATPVVTAAVVPAARVLWDQLFGSVPSLFPRK